MELQKIASIAYVIGLSISFILLCISIATPCWAVRDHGKPGGNEYKQIHYGLFQKCVWTKFNDSTECVDTWRDSAPWVKACVSMMSLSMISCLFGLIWSAMILIGFQPLKGEYRFFKWSFSRKVLPLPLATVSAFLFLLIMLITLGISTAKYTFFNDYSMYSAIASLTFLFVCTALGSVVVYFTSTERNPVSPVSV